MQLIRRLTVTTLLLGAMTWLPGCGVSGASHPTGIKPASTDGNSQSTPTKSADSGTNGSGKSNGDAKSTDKGSQGTGETGTPTSTTEGSGSSSSGVGSVGSVHVVTDPNDIDVLVNKQNALPANYAPADLIIPKIPFLYAEDNGNHHMRTIAAHALEKLFADASRDGITLYGVSAYRSYDLQKSLFDYYVKTQGETKARQYSAYPGQSEHETGLAIDVSGSSGKCAVEDCWADTPEAVWVAAHAADEGFIVRYLKGKESITGYAYEPWHIRYVGIGAAKEIVAKGWTFEEYMTHHAGSSSR